MNMNKAPPGIIDQMHTLAGYVCVCLALLLILLAAYLGTRKPPKD